MIADVPCAAMVVTGKFALLVPAAMVADAGTCATEVFELARLTTAPAGGAAPFRNSVPVEPMPPITVLGFNVTEAKDATETVSVVVFVTP